MEAYQNREEEKVDELLMPSWLSCLISVAAGLLLTIGVMLVFSFNNSTVQQQLIGLQNTAGPSLTLPGQNPPGSTQNSLQNTWPLLGFWGILGLVVYFMVETLLQLIHETSEFRKELGYVHARRDALIKDAVAHLLVRLAAVVLWLIFINIFFRRIIPYSITAAHASASDIHSWLSPLYALLAFAMVAFSLHLHTIFLRLSLSRPRVFSGS